MEELPVTEETLNDFSKYDENYLKNLVNRCQDGAKASAELMGNVLVRETILKNNGKFSFEVFNKIFFEKPLYVHAKEIVQEYIGKMPFFNEDLFYHTMIHSLHQSPKALEILEQEFAKEFERKNKGNQN